MSNLFQRFVELPLWLRAVLLIVVSAGLLFTGLRSQPIPQVFTHEDKLHHFIGFLDLSLCCRLAFLRVKLRWIALGSVLTGFLIEFSQALIPLRTASLYDALANTCGVLAGLLVAWYYTRNVKK